MITPPVRSFSDPTAGWRQRIEALTTVMHLLDPTGSLDPEVWPDLLTWPRLLIEFTREAGAFTPLRQGIQAYLQQLPGYAENDERRLRLQHEVTLLLLAGGLEPLTAAEMEDLGLEYGDESEAG
jgi:hypothetical protein